jgi:ribonuclease BN (tRNA processing enzyme)
MGLCFFEPLLTADAHSFIFGPGNSRSALTRSLQQLTHSHLFPVSIHELKGKKEIHSLRGGEVIEFGAPEKKPMIRRFSSENSRDPEGLTITTLKSPAHPRFGVMLYRVNYNGKSLVYATDVEQTESGYPDIIEFARGADLLIHDAQYRHEEYFSDLKPKKGWGHSTVEMAAEVAIKSGVKRLVLFHHEPTHKDTVIRAMERKAKQLFPLTLTAHEGMEISL